MTTSVHPDSSAIDRPGDAFDADLAGSRGSLGPVATLIERSPGGEIHHELSIGLAIVGRGGVDVPLRDKDVSRRHAAIRVEPDAAYVRDLGSKNGIVIDGEAFSDDEEHALPDGGTVTVGSTTLSLRHDGARVRRALADAGEVTHTRTRPHARSPGAPPGSMGRDGVVRPLVAAAVFLALAVVLVVFGS